MKAKAANDAIAAAQSIKKSWTDPNQLVDGAASLLKMTANEKGTVNTLNCFFLVAKPQNVLNRKNGSDVF